MQVVGIVCEYNPFHNGHAKQLAMVNAIGVSVCLMSGNYVQRGEPAVVDKMLRAEAAVCCGADLVLELPVTYALRSAEGFAAGGVELMERLGCFDAICFGSESGDAQKAMETARRLSAADFSEHLKEALSRGVSFPAARQNALEAVGFDAALLSNPNDILAVEYCKALLKYQSAIEPMTIRRAGAYHGGTDPLNPSASFLRSRTDWSNYVPENAWSCFSDAPRHTAAAGERAWLARLRSMEESEFETLPFGAEGLWRKVMHACRSETALCDIVRAAKSKRYTHTRLMRMLMCAFLGISQEMLDAAVPYVRILAMNDRGRAVLRRMHESSTVPLIHAGQTPPDVGYAALERRCEDLYGLFCTDEIEAPAAMQRERIIYRQKAREE